MKKRKPIVAWAVGCEKIGLHVDHRVVSYAGFRHRFNAIQMARWLDATEKCGPHRAVKLIEAPKKSKGVK